jgi:hypothetical protein
MVALTSIALMFGLLNIGLGLFWGPAPAKLLQSELTDADTLQAIAERVATVEKQWKGAGSTHPKLAVVTGLSTAREGIDPIQIYKTSNGDIRLLNISSSGGSFSEMRTYTEPLINSWLQPDLVIMAVHPSWLAGRQLRTSTQSPSIFRGSGDEISTETLLKQLRVWVGLQSWVLNNRQAIHSELRQFMLGWRARLHYWANISSLEPPMEVDYPWSMRITYQDLRGPPEFLQAQLRQWTSAGWFDIDRFGAQTVEAQSLRLFVNAMRDKTPNLVIVLMPESEEFRSKVPLRAAETLIDIVQAVDRAISVVDLRASLPDAMFRDHAHLNAQGRLALTQEITSRFFGPPDDVRDGYLKPPH